MITQFHRPVLAKECINAIVSNPDGCYVDATFGGGGHSRLLLEKLSLSARLFAFDRDEDSLKNAIIDKRFTLVHQNFRNLKQSLRIFGVQQIDGLLADLGVSSYQIDTSSRGFSTRFSSKLDMRMNRNSSLTAHKIINQYPIERLNSIFRNYGELKQATKISKRIERIRNQSPINRTDELIKNLEDFANPKNRNQFFAKIFQALRIEVNDELQALKKLLKQSLEILKRGGRISVVSYHSLEDRLVKRFFKTGNFEGIEDKDPYGNVDTPFRILTKKPIVPTKEEMESNNRARSAKLRIAEKI